ncbi:hypothetical protein SPBR_05017 [Sporothrix brasiliensis 5110]|uniref:Alpha and gamma adaptin binding protein p34 n=1 Tax=Sporothrix brasiliensis 5110 TaxID=1398154 RepID=A0A0C2F9T8_9PEZI|nr:uncharacterized protein SPBR_05017 [Sporothrix brasiliensis 5110]KIH87863.1 hypothetical protein SPBR_05017 [Sporothrix brasiliensis 5110]
MAPTEISNPRRILAVALAESQEHLARVIKDLTGEYPAASAGTGALAGTTQELAIQTAYYNAQVPIWLDLIGQTPAEAEAEAEAESAKDEPKEEEGKPDETNDAPKEPEDGPTKTDEDSPSRDNAKTASKDDTTEDPSTPEQWADAFLADEAREVREALGGVVVVVDVQQTSAFARQRDLVKHVARLVQRLGPVVDVGLQEEDEDQEEMLADFEGVGIVVGVSQTPIDEETMEVWDDACLVAGLEFVAVAPGQEATNEFGEKTGIPRLLEALEANDWELVGDGEGDENDLFGSFQDVRLPGTESDDEINFDDPESVDFGFDRDDFAGLRQAIWQQQTAELDDDDEEDKDQAAIMESMIQRLQAARLQSELLTPAQRRAMAARVVGDVMREI